MKDNTNTTVNTTNNTKQQNITNAKINPTKNFIFVPHFVPHFLSQSAHIITHTLKQVNSALTAIKSLTINYLILFI